MRKLNFGCGGNRLEGWENFDIEVDISKPLPFPDGCASHIFAEHVVEHVTHQQAWGFFDECFRVLASGGGVRIAIPDITTLWGYTDRHCRFNNEAEEAAWEEMYLKAASLSGDTNGAARAMVFNHGHKAAWTDSMLYCFLSGAGFDAVECRYGISEEPEFNGIEGHGDVVGQEIAMFETSVVEGWKA